MPYPLPPDHFDDDLGPVTAAERAEIRLEPAVEVPPPSPVASVQHAPLPPDLPFWCGYHEVLEMRPGTATGIYRLPDHLAGLWLHIDEGRAGSVQRASLITFGARSRLGYIPICEGEAGIGALFPLAALPAVLGVPNDETTDLCLSLVDLWGPAADHLAERFALCHDHVERLVLFNRILRRRLRRHLDAGGRRVLAAARSIEHSGGVGPIDVIADRLGLGRRQLERLFADRFGIAPKRYARAVRFQCTLQRLIASGDGPIDWAGLAAESGFCDQSHLIHEFREFTGLNPGGFLAIPDIRFTLRYGAVVTGRPRR